MLLIDALNIRQGGGKVLLDYLEQELKQREVEFFILKNKELDVGSQFGHGIQLNSGAYFNRTKVLNGYIKDLRPKKLFCFGNFPPNVKFDNIEVITFFQNALLLKSDGLKSFSTKNYLILALKKLYFRFCVKNSDSYVVQTPTIRKRILSTFKIEPNNCRVLPFFDEGKILQARADFAEEVEKKPGTFIYPSSSHAHKNHENLLNAWEALLQRQKTPILYLTIPIREDTTAMIRRIDDLNEKGAQIINLKALPNYELLKWIYQSEFMIYPSLEETIGISLIEGVLLDNKILVSQKPYYKNVVKPSSTFDPGKVEEIVQSVEKAMEGNLPPSEKVIKNNIDQLINLLTQ